MKQFFQLHNKTVSSMMEQLFQPYNKIVPSEIIVLEQIYWNTIILF